MIDFLQNVHPVIQALIATTFTWMMTALGASGVFFVLGLSRKLMDGMLGFSAGIMIAVSFWSLLAPSLAMSEGLHIPAWLPATAGFLIGGLFLLAIDKTLPHLHRGLSPKNAEGIKTSWPKSILLFLAITLHNIPEGLAVGVAFGAVAAGIPYATIMSAVALAVGIGIQNIPEGLSVSLLLKSDGMSTLKSFWYGQLTGMVKPITGVIGAASVFYAQSILPYALGFAAGAMIFVVVEELIPESRRNDNTDIATMGLMAGFAVMMVLEAAFC